MPYTAPVGTINPNWGGSTLYYPPIGHVSTGFNELAQYISPIGFDNLLFGEQTASSNRSILAQGFDAAQYGQHWVNYAFNYYGLQSAELNATWLGKSIGWQSFALIDATFAPTQRVNALGIKEPDFNNQAIQNNRFIEPTGFAEQFGDLTITTDEQYAPSFYQVNASWLNEDPYTAPTGGANARFTPAKKIFARGIDSFELGEHRTIYRQFIQPNGFDSTKFGGHFTTFTYEFVSRLAEVDASWVGQQDYTPSIGFLNAVWIRPTGFNYIPPVGIDYLEFGQAAVRNQFEYVAASGFKTDQYGLPSIALDAKAARPNGFIATAYGTARVSRAVAEIRTGNISSMVFGVAKIENKERFINTNGFNAQLFGVQLVAFGLRYINTNGHDSARYGTATIRFKTQQVQAAGFDSQRFGALTSRLEYRFIAPQGFDSLAFGTRIVPQEQTAITQGFKSDAFGTTKFDLAVLRINAIGFKVAGNEEAQRYGQSTVQLKTRFIAQTPSTNNGLAPIPISTQHFIENRNKTIRTFGHVDSRFGFADLVNGARVVRPIGLDATQFGQNMIAYAVRNVTPEPIESSFIPNFHAIYNNARVLPPSGINSFAAGAHAIESNRKAYLLQGFESAVYGGAFVAYAVRSIEIDRFQSISPPFTPNPNVRLYTRYVLPPGITAPQIGNAFVREQFNVIAPKWTERDFFGDATLRNNTPELAQFGHDSSQFGQTAIRTQFRFLQALGHDSLSFGQQLIARRTRLVGVTGINSYRSGLTSVIRQQPPEFSLQRIIVDDGIGIPENLQQEPKLFQVSEPRLNQNVIRPESINADNLFGEHRITSNVIKFEVGDDYLLFGQSAIGLRIRSIAIESIDKGDNFENTPSSGRLHRLSPHTIWAVKEAPVQARTNHNAQNLHYVNEVNGIGGNYRPPGVVVGVPRITNKDRVIAPISFVATRYGNHSVKLDKQIILPTGQSFMRFGVVSIPFTPQSILLLPANAINMMVFGQARIAYGPVRGTQTISPTGTRFTVYGANEIQLQNRSVTAQGFDSARMGTRKINDTPFMWQGLRIGAPVPTVPNGFDAARYGMAWVSLAVRNIEAIGFDSFISEYDLQFFRQRMTVRNAQSNEPPAQTIRPHGYSAMLVATPDVKLGVHYIRPDGNTDNFRKGAP